MARLQSEGDCSVLGCEGRPTQLGTFCSAHWLLIPTYTRAALYRHFRAADGLAFRAAIRFALAGIERSQERRAAGG